MAVVALKTLVFVVEDRDVVLAVIPADKRLHYGRLASVLGASRSRIAHADPVTVRELGMQPGGVAPVRTRPDVRIVFDESVGQMGTVWCGSGVAEHSLQLSVVELLRIAGDATVGCIVAAGA
jgi:Cys-tRNA(Pro)/Cys-tRNA(Cys) deacylase